MWNLTSHLREWQKKPLHRFLFYLLILLIPTQLGKHFWPDWSLVLGIRIDYLSPTIYLTDVVIVILLLTWFLTCPPRPRVRHIIFTATFLALSILNILLSRNQAISSYKWLKVGEFILLGFYVAKTRTRTVTITALLGVAVIFSTILAVFQFIHHGSLGGWLYWLGERTFTGSTAGIATGAINNTLVLRPYATFSHPNVLAGFLVVTLPLLLFSGRHVFPWIQHGAVFLSVVTIVLTMSRSAWIVGLVLLVFGAIRKIREIRQRKDVKGGGQLALVFALLTGGLSFWFWQIGILSSRISLFTDRQSITIRQDLNTASLKMFVGHPLTGVGLGSFITQLPHYLDKPTTTALLQPAHNIYLLLFAETGLVGLWILVVFLLAAIPKIIRQKRPLGLTLAFMAILSLGLFDHYFFTLQQTQILFAIIGGLVCRENSQMDKLKKANLTKQQ